MTDVPEPEGTITTKSVIAGFIATLHAGDGESTEYWARTEQEAREKAENARQ